MDQRFTTLSVRSLLKMRAVFVLAVAVAVSAIPYKFDHDIKMDVLDVFKSLYAAAPLKSYTDILDKGKDFIFTEEFFHFYPDEKIKDFIVVFKSKTENYHQAYYIRAEDVSKYDDTFFDAVRPLYEYLNSGDYYAFTPLAAKKILPDYFKFPLKKIHYDYYKDVDVNREIPLVFLVPKSEVDAKAVEDLIHVADYEITQKGTHVVNEHFEGVKKDVKREAYVDPIADPYYYDQMPYPYDPYDPYTQYPENYQSGYHYPGYPEVYVDSGRYAI